jgi:hypothetical protein
MTKRRTIMSSRWKWLAIMAVAGVGILGIAAPVVRSAGGKAQVAVLAAQALAADPGAARAAVAGLREAGPVAVGALLRAQRESPAPAERFREVLDTVCAQRDCTASHLFWYTDLGRARAEARRTGRPILSLRLLGRLDEEMSCANSRFFRTVLYANDEVSRLLRERFVLHWSSVRPVPKVTIDFGGGRTLKGTITGNSIHYVLDARGRLVDGLPGLYGPGAFRRLLEADGREAERLSALDEEKFSLALADFHSRANAEVEAALARDLERVGAPRQAIALARLRPRSGVTPTAYQAAPLAESKMAIEIKPLESLSIAGRLQEVQGVDWGKVAALHREDWRLDTASLVELKRKQGERDRGELAKVAAGFERLVGVDTVRNEFILHVVLHAWLGLPGEDRDLDHFNDRVYADLFLTPGSDPWLGLASAETFMALEPAAR